MNEIYNYPFDWDFIDDSGNLISISQQQNQGIDKETMQNAIDTSLDTIHLTGEDLIYTLTVNGKTAGQIVIPKDQFLKDIQYNQETKSLEFIFETENGVKNITINLNDLIDIYEAGNGIDLENGKFNIKISDSTESYLEVSADGIKVVGIDAALSLKADKEQVYTKEESDSKYLTEHQDVSNLATKESLENVSKDLNDLTDNVPTLNYVNENFDNINNKFSDYALKQDIPSLEGYVKEDALSDMETKTNANNIYQPKGDYALRDEIPTKLSELENDVPYLTQHQDISNLATKEELNEIKAIIVILENRIKILERRVLNKNEFDKAISSLVEGETADIILLNNLVIGVDDENNLIIPKDCTVNLNLNGNNIVFEKDDILFRVNGTLNINCNGGSIKGVGYVASANVGGTVNVENGNYENDVTCFQANGGILNIYDGMFKVTSEEYGTKYTLNHIDSKKNDGLISVKGGTFVNYDPSNSNSENPPMNFVAEGYTVISENVGDDVYYKVVKE